MNHFDTSSLLLLLIIVIQTSRASNNGLNDELGFLRREIGLLRNENQNQNKEIAMLKEIVGFQNNNTIPNQIVSLIKRELDEQKKKESVPPLIPVPPSTDGNRSSSPRNANRRNKRPYRLIQARDSSKEGNYKINRKFYGPPANCSELSQLGYTLNGFYLVKAHEIKNNSNIIKDDDKIKVEIISCAFKNPGGVYQPSNIIQSKASVSLNHADSSKPTNAASDRGIYFRVWMRSKLESKVNTDVLFNQVLLNNGGGFYNTATGQFTVPKTGIYQITFNGLIRSQSATQIDPTFIHLYVNNGQSGEFTRIVDSQRSNQVLLVTRKLERTSKISIFIHIGYGDRFELESHATFSVFLLE